MQNLTRQLAFVDNFHNMNWLGTQLVHDVLKTHVDHLYLLTHNTQYQGTLLEEALQGNGTTKKLSLRHMR